MQKTEEAIKVRLNQIDEQTTPEEMFERIEKVKSIVKEQLPEALRDNPEGKALIALLVKHHEALSLSDREMGHAIGVTHEIDTGDHHPIMLTIR